MDDEDGTCLLDVLCDPQALNDFLHGTSEQLETEDLLINAAGTDSSLFTDSTSPASLLADDPPVQGAPPPGCVDLSFLEETLLRSPPQPPSEGMGSEERGEEREEEVEVEVEEACDILRQSLQEADITEQTLAEEAGLAAGALTHPGDVLPLYEAPVSTPAPAAPFLPKALTVHPLHGLVAGLQNIPKDTQGAVDPPQPSLMAVGPGCPSLLGKPAPPQFMSLLPGTVFPTPTMEPPLTLNPAQSSSVLIQKALPNFNGSSLFTSASIANALRTNPQPGLFLPRGPLMSIQPKLPISIQPRLVQISPKPPGTAITTAQHPNPPSGLTFVSGSPSQNLLLSGPPHNSIVKQQQQQQQHPPPQGLAKPVSLQLLNQAGSIVIQPQGIFPAPNQFILPGHLAGNPPVTIPQPTAGLTNQSSAGQPTHGVRRNSSGQVMDTSQILPGQLNFGPVFTTPSGQLAVRQGTILSGPLQFQPGIFQMPAHLAGAFTPQPPGPRGGATTVQPPQTLLHSAPLANHITVLNSSGVLGRAVSVQHNADLASLSIVNGQAVVPGQRPTLTPLVGAEGAPRAQPSAAHREESVLGLQGPLSNGQLLHLQQPQVQNQIHLQTANQIQPQSQTQLQILPAAVLQSQAVSSLQAQASAQLLDPAALVKDSLPSEPAGPGPRAVTGNSAAVQHLQQQVLQLPDPPPTSNTVTTPSLLTGQTVGLPSTPINHRETAAPTNPVVGQAVTLSSPLANQRQAVTPTPPVNGQAGALSSPLLGQTVTPTNPVVGQAVTLSSPLANQRQAVTPTPPVNGQAGALSSPLLGQTVTLTSSQSGATVTLLTPVSPPQTHLPPSVQLSGLSVQPQPPPQMLCRSSEYQQL
ncbi:UNVERIFIED_CONTAM: hypothetical protein FKN15_032799 [Acipenser sinensis]